MTTWFITGCSTGLGRALAATALERGENVVVTARNAGAIVDLARSYPDTALALPLDITDQARRAAAIAAALERFGAIDVLINNAGYGYRAAVEEASDEQVHQLFATNFFGPVALIQDVLPAMRARRHGTIVNVSSGGVRSCPLGAGHYVATKAALEAVTWSLGREVRPLGLTVMAVEPGGFRTDYKQSLAQPRQTIDAYASTVGARRREDPAEHGRQLGDPVRAAEAVVAAVESPDPPRLLVLGTDAVSWFRDSVAELTADVDAWERTSAATGFPA